MREPRTSNLELQTSKRGGRRPGALKPCPEPAEGTVGARHERNRGGAPKGNLNALKHGRRSPRLQATQAVLQALERSAPDIARLARAERRKRELIAHALRILADLILACPASQTTRQLLPILIPKAVRRAKKLAQTTGQPLLPVLASLFPVPGSCHNHLAMPVLSAAEGTAERPIRVLIAKPGLDGHDRGAKVVARALRDAGMEVIYTGIRQTPEMIAEAALQEDVQVVGLSILSGAHLELFPRVVRALKDRGVDPGEILLFAGGIIPDEDIPALKELGFREVFRPGASTRDIIDYVRRWSAERAQRVGNAGG